MHPPTEWYATLTFQVKLSNGELTPENLQGLNDVVSELFLHKGIIAAKSDLHESVLIVQFEVPSPELN